MCEREDAIVSAPIRILHVDGDSFFASCEVALDPKLRERPGWVGGGHGHAPATSAGRPRCPSTCPRALDPLPLLPYDEAEASLVHAHVLADLRLNPFSGPSGLSAFHFFSAFA